MPGLRTVAFGLFVAGFGVFAYLGIEGWARVPSGRGAVETSKDEHPLETGYLENAQHALGMKGYPWRNLGEQVNLVKRDPPLDTGHPTAEDAEKANIKLLERIVLVMPPGNIKWPDLFARVKRQVEAKGIKVTTETPAVSDAWNVDLPSKPWTASELLGYVFAISQEAIHYKVTSEGLVFGTSEAVNRGVRTAGAAALQRRSAADNADPALDAQFRPDMQDATLDAFARVVEAQTGVPMVVDSMLWERGIVVAWRGEPRKLRDALDQLAPKLRAYWRYKDGKIWLLVP